MKGFMKWFRGGCVVECASTPQTGTGKLYVEGLYDEHLPSSYLNCLDANMLYGLAMCQKLPS